MRIRQKDIDKFFVDGVGTIYKMTGYDNTGELCIGCDIYHISNKDTRDAKIGKRFWFSKNGIYINFSDDVKEWSLQKKITKKENPEYFL